MGLYVGMCLQKQNTIDIRQGSNTSLLSWGEGRSEEILIFKYFLLWFPKSLEGIYIHFTIGKNKSNKPLLQDKEIYKTLSIKIK